MSSDQQEIDYFDRFYTHLESAAYINQALLKDVEALFSTHGLESMKPLFDGLMALKNMNDLALKEAGSIWESCLKTKVIYKTIL